MSNMELEMKILNINEKELSRKIEKLGGKYISTSKQYLYVYDLMYINQRYHSYLYELNNENLNLRKDINLEKIKNLFFEIDQLLSDTDILFLKNKFNINNLSEIFTIPETSIEKILKDKKLLDFIDKYKMSPKKWIRLRKTIEENANGEQKETTTLTIKHILKNDSSGIQQMKETEILVNSLEDTNFNISILAIVKSFILYIYLKLNIPFSKSLTNFSFISGGNSGIFFISSIFTISGKYFPLSTYFGLFENSGPCPVPNFPPIYSQRKKYSF